jgi:hypothetical protein
VSIREIVVSELTGDATMNGLGITTDTLWTNNAPDSAPSDVFAILRWGTEVRPLRGNRNARELEVALWPYDRNPDYGRISQINKRWCLLLEALVGQSTGDGWVLGVQDPQEGPDAFDDVYGRVTRPASYTIIFTTS